MTNEEAYADIVDYMGNGCCNGDNALPWETLETASDALAKQIKNRWHDLRKDSEDLPEDKMPDTPDIEVWAHPNYVAHGYAMTASAYWLKKYAKSSGYNIIAWRYIEPFEEVMK